MARTQAYNISYGTVNVWGYIDIFKYGSSIYVAIPTDASEGDKLAFFQDANASWILFRNNTLALPVNSQSASIMLATGDLVSDGTRFYGQVTGMELDTLALKGDGASAAAVLYLDDLPGHATYHISLEDNEDIEKAILGEASKSGQPGSVKLMLDVSGKNSEAQGSIDYSIIRMKADGPEPDGNVTAYRYYNGAVAALPCKTITSADGIVYETIYSGPGTFAFVGPFPEKPPERASIMNVLAFSSIIAVIILILVSVMVTILRKRRKK